MELISQRERLTIMFAIMMAMLFAAVNQTIVGTALPRIVSHLGGMNHFDWVFTIYILCASMASILVGRLSDLYGRKPFILLGIALFMFASFLAGLSQSMLQLILYRGFQGIGGGMIMSTAFAAVGDLFSPRERGRWQGLLGSIFGIASLIGPGLGGFIVDHAEWRWVFWIFLPFGFVAIYLIWRLFPAPSPQGKQAIDYWGSFFLMGTLLPLLVAISRTSSEYGWLAWQTLALLIVTLSSLLAFIRVEKRAINPVLPLSLFRNQIFLLSNLINFLLGLGMFATTIYLPFFIQGVQGLSAMNSGFIMMTMTISMVIASAIAGQLLTKTGRYKVLAWWGLALMSVGMWLLSQMNMETSILAVIIKMSMTGLGLGIAFPIFILTVQNVLPSSLLGVGTASVQLFRQLGGMLGVSILGSIMNARMQRELRADGVAPFEHLIPVTSPSNEESISLEMPQALMNPEQLDQLFQAVPNGLEREYLTWLEMMRVALNSSLSQVFLVATIFTISGCLLTLALREIPLRTARGSRAEG